MRTLVGYAGGTKKNPTYRSLGDHTETLRIEFDPACMTFERLLGVFWASHDPFERSWSRQYRAVVFVHGDEQRRVAERTRAEVAARAGGRVQTEIEPAGEFYRAEDYHQKHCLRGHPDLLDELAAAYPDPADLARSTAAARVNGYLGGYGTFEELEVEGGRLGLSPRAEKRLKDLVTARRR